jgi:hypothetical protein
MAADMNFDQIIAQIRSIVTRAQIIVEEVPAPQKLAPYAFAMTADVTTVAAIDNDESDDEDIATARFVLLHDPAGQEGWLGNFRCVTFVRSTIDQEMANDPMLASVGWSWLLDALAKNNCVFLAPSGTVTRVASSSFGSLDERADSAELEVRASWTPIDGNQIALHVRAWLDLLEQAAGLEPIPEGVSELHRSPISK